jgi:hypothetical protein
MVISSKPTSGQLQGSPMSKMVLGSQTCYYTFPKPVGEHLIHA